MMTSTTPRWRSGLHNGLRLGPGRLACQQHHGGPGGQPRQGEDHQRGLPAERLDERRANERHQQRADVAARHVSGNRESTSARAVAIGENRVARRVLGRAANAAQRGPAQPRQERNGGRGHERRHRDDQVADANQHLARDAATEVAKDQLEQSARQARDGANEANLRIAEAVLVVQNREDERHQDADAVEDGMGRADGNHIRAGIGWRQGCELVGRKRRLLGVGIEG
jgi:hypothetical protein